MAPFTCQETGRARWISLLGLRIFWICSSHHSTSTDRNFTRQHAAAPRVSQRKVAVENPLEMEVLALNIIDVAQRVINTSGDFLKRSMAWEPTSQTQTQLAGSREVSESKCLQMLVDALHKQTPSVDFGITFVSSFPSDPEPKGHTHQRYYLLTQMAISEESSCNKEIQSED